MRALGHGAGKEEDAVGAAGQAGCPQHQLQEGNFGVALGSIGLEAGGAAFREAVLFLVKSRLCHSSVAVSLIFLADGNNRQD